jgi:nucleotide-binding universal stress UspA family protein
MNLLICTDGSRDSLQAIAFLRLLQLPADTAATMLAVAEFGRRAGRLEACLQEMQQALEAQGFHPERIVRRGQLSREILEAAEKGHYDLVAIGAPVRQGLLRSRLTATASDLSDRLKAPLLIARNVPAQIGRTLICTSAATPARETLLRGGALVSRLGAPTSVVHVMSQVALDLDSPQEDLVLTAEQAIARGTREGKHLQEAIGWLREAGVAGEVAPRLRHGLVADEILSELEDQAYGLLVLGAHSAAGRGHLMEALLDDITEQLIARSPCSVLVVWHDPLAHSAEL